MYKYEIPYQQLSSQDHHLILSPTKKSAGASQRLAIGWIEFVGNSFSFLPYNFRRFILTPPHSTIAAMFYAANGPKLTICLRETMMLMFPTPIPAQTIQARAECCGANPEYHAIIIGCIGTIDATGCCGLDHKPAFNIVTIVCGVTNVSSVEIRNEFTQRYKTNIDS